MTHNNNRLRSRSNLSAQGDSNNPIQTISTSGGANDPQSQHHLHQQYRQQYSQPSKMIVDIQVNSKSSNSINNKGNEGKQQQPLGINIDSSNNNNGNQYLNYGQNDQYASQVTNQNDYKSRVTNFQHGRSHSVAEKVDKGHQNPIHNISTFQDNKQPKVGQNIDNINKNNEQSKVGFNKDSEVAFFQHRVNDSVKAFNKFKNNQLKRLNTLKNHLQDEQKVVKGCEGTSEYYEKELLLLRKVRENNTNSQKMRLRTGGNLVGNGGGGKEMHSKATLITQTQDVQNKVNVNQNHNESVSWLDNISRDDKNETNTQHQEQLPDTKPQFSKYFKQNSKYPTKVNSRSTSRLRQKQNDHQTQQQQVSIQQSMQPVKKVRKVSEQTSGRSTITPLKQKNPALIKEGLFQSVQVLPVTLAPNITNKQLKDYQYYKGCNFLHAGDYEQAIQCFTLTPRDLRKDKYSKEQSQTDHQYVNELCLFNHGVCLFKMGNIQEAIKLWLQIKILRLEIIAQYNLSLAYILSDNLWNSVDNLDQAVQNFSLCNLDWLNIQHFKSNCFKIIAQQQSKLDQLQEKQEIVYNAYQQEDQDENQVQAAINQTKRIQELLLYTGETNNLGTYLNNNKDTNYQQQDYNFNSQRQNKRTSFNKLRSLSIFSGSEQLSTVVQSPRQIGLDINQFQRPSQAILINNDEDYFPVPFAKKGKRHLQEMNSKVKHGPSKSTVPLISTHELMYPIEQYKPNKLDLELSRVNEMSHSEMESVVFKLPSSTATAQPINKIKINNNNNNASFAGLKSYISNSKEVSRENEKTKFEKVQFNTDSTFSLYDNQQHFGQRQEQSQNTEGGIKQIIVDQITPISENELQNLSFDKFLEVHQQSFTKANQSVLLNQEIYPNNHNQDLSHLGLPNQNENDPQYNNISSIYGDPNNYQMNHDSQDNDSLFQESQHYEIQDKVPYDDENDQKMADKQQFQEIKQNIKQFSRRISMLSEHQLQRQSILEKQIDEKINITKTNKSNINWTNKFTNKNTPDDLSPAAMMDSDQINDGGSGTEGEQNEEEEEDHDKPKDLSYKRRLRIQEVDIIVQFLNRNQAQNSDFEQALYDSQFEEVDQYFKRLIYFAKYPKNLRKLLIQGSVCKKYEPGEIIFNQGEESQQFYVILRGSAKVILIKQDYGNIPIIINTIYDGKEFGEVNHYETSDNLSQEMVSNLNRQQYTCEATEKSYILALDKEKTNKILNQGLQASFEKRIEFLKSISIFKGIDMHVLFTLANNIKTEHFKLGEYILKEGQLPRGLYIIAAGQCKVGSEKVNMRSKTPSKYQRVQQNGASKKQFRFKGNFSELERITPQIQEYQNGANGKEEEAKTLAIEKDKQLRARIEKASKKHNMKSEKRVFQNDIIPYDDNGQQIKDHIVYKDVMVFSKLVAKDFFGGRVLLVGNNSGVNNNSNETNNNESNLTTSDGPIKKPLQEQVSILSVIADSSEVKVYLVDRNQLSFFPDNVQKELFQRIEGSLSADRPYEAAIVDDIKDKFREWEKYKLETVNMALKLQYMDRKKSQILNINR